jgi:plasmid maintenance system antidote protein VapI
MVQILLKKAILDSGLKQFFLAKRIGVEPTIFSKKVNGHLPITDDEKQLLAEVFGLDVNDLFAQE